MPDKDGEWYNGGKQMAVLGFGKVAIQSEQMGSSVLCGRLKGVLNSDTVVKAFIPACLPT